jgi:hypothetical protein
MSTRSIKHIGIEMCVAFIGTIVFAATASSQSCPPCYYNQIPLPGQARLLMALDGGYSQLR